MGLALLLTLATGVRAREGQALERRAEPVEGAFTMLVPAGWSADGGLFRVDPGRAGGPLNSMEAKCGLGWRGANGREFRILPDWTFAHPGVGGGFFLPGSVYQGATVRPLQDAGAALREGFAALRPGARLLSEPVVKRLPGEIRALEAGLQATNALLAAAGLGGQPFRADAAGAVFDYEQDGRRWREAATLAVVDMPAALSWKTTRGLSFRAPLEDFERARPLFDAMRASIRFDPGWVLREAQGQRERAETVLRVQEEIRRVDEEILAKSRVNREEIVGDEYLVLSGQEEYLDPVSGETVVDTDAWRFRWRNAAGDVYYTDREDEDPGAFLHGAGWTRTPVRPRRNE